MLFGFTDHPRDSLGGRYVYAVLSRRAGGLSIGINLNPDKLCNFACPYCQVDRTTPGGPHAIDLDVLARELEATFSRAGDLLVRESAHLKTGDASLRRWADVAFAGDGEPTAAVEFPEAARLVRRLRDRHGLAVPLRLLTNATMLHRTRVRQALPEIDELWCKLDAGTEAWFRIVNGAQVPLERIVSNLLSVARERPIVVQSLFMTLDGVGPAGEEIEAYRGRLAALSEGGGRIDRVQVTTVARRPADPCVRPLSTRHLEAIARGVRALGFRAEVFGCPEAEA
jgi:wyosine [tRNA(Phe)-imidazoG37] synthetase (radical SAM superfamily)